MPKLDLLFVCSSAFDETFVRQTALLGSRMGLGVGIACADRRRIPRSTRWLYRQLGVAVYERVSLAEAGAIQCQIAVTPSSGINREIFPTSAQLLIHMPHSLASLHAIYPAGSFDGYNGIFAAGPHQMSEFEAIVSERGLRDRFAIPTGYGKLDYLAELLRQAPVVKSRRPQVLVAPSWGNSNLLEKCGLEFVFELARSGVSVVIRPHPLFTTEHPSLLRKIVRACRFSKRISFENPFSKDSAILNSDVLVGDFSGTGFEFKALRGKPVVSVDVPQKIVNQRWVDLGLPAVEFTLRSNLGPVVLPLTDQIVEAVHLSIEAGREPGEADCSGFLFGRPGSCSTAAVKHIQELVKMSANG